MGDGIYSAASGAIAQERSLSVVANNVANASTTGFRGDRVAFSEALNDARVDPKRTESLRYVVLSRVETDHTPGALKQTGNPLDVALLDEGYFAIETPSGERFTRAGSFVADPEGTLRTLGGHAVLGSGGSSLSIPQGASEVGFGEDGTLLADGRSVGKLRVVRFAEPQGLVKEGLTFFAAPQGVVPEEVESGQVAQGHIENANVNAVAGMNELITVSRSFEAFQKVIQTFRELDDRTARELGARG